MTGRAADGAGVLVDLKLRLREPATRRAWRLGPAPRINPGLFEGVQQPAGPVGAVAVDRQELVGDPCRLGLGGEVGSE